MKSKKEPDDWVEFSKSFRHDSLLEVDDDTKICKMHKGQLHKLKRSIQEQQGEVETYV